VRPVVSKALRFISALGAVFFALVGLTACGGGGGVPGDAVAKVDETPITTAAFKHWMTVAAVSTATTGGGALAAKPATPEPPEYAACIAHLKEVAINERSPTGLAKGRPMPTVASLKSACVTQYKGLLQEVLSFLLSSQWVIGEAKSVGVKVSDAEVKKQFEKIKTQQFPRAAEFEKFLSTSGQTVSDLLLRVKLNLLSAKIQQKVAKQKGSVSNAQIEKYFNENKSRYSTPEKRGVNIILTHSEAQAKSAKAEIQSGKNFSSVAKKVSVDPTKAAGGVVSEVVKGQEVKGLDEALFAASKNTLGGPVKTAFGYYIYEVTSITPGTSQSLAQARPSIKAQLAATQQQEALSKFVKEFKKKWMAKTDCRTGYVVADCKQYKAPKTSGSGTAVTPGG
jgi:foldase protein PrsA